MKHTKSFLTFACISLLCASSLYGCQKTEKADAPKQTESQKETDAPKQTETQKPTETQKQTEPQSESPSETQTEPETTPDAPSNSSDKETRYFYDEAGNTIYTTQNADGNWVDDKGTSYTFLETSVKDNNGTTYYYDPPAYRDDNSSSSSSSSVSGTDTGEAVDVYRKDGTLVRLTKDSNGNWADKNGLTYVLGEDGATDSNGEFHPW